jgi:formamidopyrimidine-DNA glycosylase
MPELPEVETLCRQLRRVIVGEEILKVEVLDPRLGALDGLERRRILSVKRYGKTLKLEMGRGASFSLHLRMTGRFQWRTNPDIPPHTRLVFSFRKGHLFLIDPRRFATIVIQGIREVPGQAQDPLRDMNTSRLSEAAGKRKLPVKSFLMDQRVIAGIGNIYACEILHRTGINPLRKVCHLSGADWSRVAGTAKAVLTHAVACRGTTVSDWRDLYGRPGGYQKHLRVYGREGDECPECGESIRRITLGGRGTWYCPGCQK